MYVEVEENPNCSDPVSVRFKVLGPARKIKQVKLSDRADGRQLFMDSSGTGAPRDGSDPAEGGGE